MASMRRYLTTLSGGAAVAALVLLPSLGQAADDPRDAAFLAPVLQRALETARTNVEVPWSNPATGSRGGIVVERTFYREPDTPCRAYLRTLETPGAALQVTRGTGCRDSSGLWLIEEEPAGVAGAAGRAPPAPDPAAFPPPAAGPETLAPETLAEVAPACPDTVLVPMPAARPPALAYTMPSRAAL
jgi:surface antigen